MKIVLINEEFGRDTGQGVSGVAGELYKNLKELGCEVEKIELGASKNPFKRIFINIFINSFKLYKTKADIYHFIMPEVSFPVLLKRPSVVTVNDIIPMILKDERKKSFNIYFKLMMMITKKANKIISISNSTRDDLINHLDFKEEDIKVCYCGVDHNKFFPIKRKENKKLIVGFLGGLVKRKNATMILDVAKMLEKENILFKIGGKGFGLKELIEKKERLNIKNVEFVGFIPDNELNKFYNSLDLFIVPTTYDGFSLPGVEAMASGCPLMISSNGALPEVGGDASIFINPYDKYDIAKKMETFIKDKNLRIKMKEKSITQARNFDWKKQAREILEVYKELLK